MIHIKLEAEIEHVEALVNLIKGSGLASKIDVEDLDDQNLRQMTATDFYKRINAANLAQKEQRVFSQEAIEREVQAW